jgi:protein-L-isoaspartate(D-aspartate) O-methyltransferase
MGVLGTPTAGAARDLDARALLRELGLRRRLVDGLVASGHLRSAATERAFRKVPRDRFLPPDLAPRAHIDQTVVVEADGDGLATLSSTAPWMMAEMLELLDVRPGQRVLEIGTGTGYHAALLSELTGVGGSVRSEETNPRAAQAARQRLRELGFANVTVATSGAGPAPGSRFDRIVATCDAWPLPVSWASGLTDGGVLVAPLGGFLHRFERRGDRLVGGVTRSSHFMPRVPSRFARRWRLPPLPESEDHASPRAGMVLQSVELPLDASLGRWLCDLQPVSAPTLLRSVKEIGARRGERVSREGRLDGLRLYLSLAERRRFAHAEALDATRGMPGWGFGVVDVESASAAFLAFTTPHDVDATPRDVGALYACGGSQALDALVERIEGWLSSGAADCADATVLWSRGLATDGFDYAFGPDEPRNGRLAYRLQGSVP